MKSFLKAEGSWVIRIVFSLLALFLTIRFSLPVTQLIDKGCSLFIIEKAESVTLSPAPKDEAPAEEITGEQTKQSTSVYVPHSDIAEFEAEYLAAFGNTASAGSTREVFFRTSGATDTVSGISIKNGTATKKPDFEALVKEGPDISIRDKTEPTVLIYHTHTTESYLLSDNGVFYEDYATRSTDSAKNMIRVGDEICRVLKENGIGFIHDTGVYDEMYEGAYSRSRVSVEKYLEEYPTIQIVLDVHRDAIYYSDTERAKPTAEIDGLKAAQIMIITGAEEGYITNFPNWENNLKFALLFQSVAEEHYEGLMKPLYFCQRKYNMDLGVCSVLLEMGSDANTLEEAMYSGYLTGRVLTEIIKNYEKK